MEEVVRAGARGKLVESSGGTTWFFATNHLGTIAARMNVSGTLMETYRYLPYGERDAGTQTPHQYTGKERDSESGLDYFGARYYASAHGRWMSVDPVVQMGDPQRLNRYSYTLGNPILFTDGDGRVPNCGIAITSQIITSVQGVTTFWPPETRLACHASLPGSHSLFANGQDAVMVSGSEREHSVPDLPGLEVSQAVTMAQGILRSRRDCAHFFGEGASAILNQTYNANNIRLLAGDRPTKDANGQIKVTFAQTENISTNRIFINSNAGFLQGDSPVAMNTPSGVRMEFNMVSFLNSAFRGHLGDFTFNADTARAFVVIHELGHLLPGENRFPSDHGNQFQVDANSIGVIENCFKYTNED